MLVPFWLKAEVEYFSEIILGSKRPTQKVSGSLGTANAEARVVSYS